MKLIFVYNANSGAFNAFFDIAHKILKPETYECALCALTNEAFLEKKAWKDFKERTNVPMEFYHKDEFEKKYGESFQYPIILTQAEGFAVVVSANEISKLGDVDALIQQIEKVTVKYVLEK